MQRKIIIGLMTLVGLIGCGRPQINDHHTASPEFNIAAYFEGSTRAWGHFQDRFGKVRRRFVVDIFGEWRNDTLVLTEDFVYADGETEQRVWTLSKTGATTWQGSADGVVGFASGQVSGNAFNWRYTFDLKMGEGETLRVDFDDWMWRQDAQVVINRAYVSKLGIDVGEVLIFFSKE